MALFFLDLDKDYKQSFDLAQFLDISDGESIDILTSYFLHELKKLKTSGSYVVTFEENNPELLADIIFNNPHYEWILMEYNDLTDIKDVVSGLTLYYPSLTDLEDLKYKLITKQSEFEKTVNNNTNITFQLDGNFTEGGSSTPTPSIGGIVFPFTNADVIICDHSLNKRPSVDVYEIDINGNRVSIGFSHVLPLNQETTRVIVYLEQPMTGEVVLN